MAGFLLESSKRMQKTTAASSQEEICRSIQQQGFAVIPDALNAAQITVANRVIDADVRSNSQAWAKFDETLLQSVDMLSRTEIWTSPLRTRRRSGRCACS
jgi:hypothetical protein